MFVSQNNNKNYQRLEAMFYILLWFTVTGLTETTISVKEILKTGFFWAKTGTSGKNYMNFTNFESPPFLI